MTAVTVSRLAELAVSSAKKTKLAEEHANKAVIYAIEAGRDLIEAKALLDHGEFTPWLLANSITTERNAQRYMKAARNYDASEGELLEGVTIDKLIGRTDKVKTAPGAVLVAPTLPDPAIAEATNRARIAEAQAKRLQEELLKAKTPKADPEVARLAAEAKRLREELVEAKKPKVDHSVEELRKELKKYKEAFNKESLEHERLIGVVRNLQEKQRFASTPPAPKKGDPREFICSYVRKASDEKVLGILEAIRRMEHPDRNGGNTEITSQLNVLIGEMK